MALQIGLNLGLTSLKACLIEKTVIGWKYLDYREHYFKSNPTDEEYVNVLKGMFSEEERLSATFYCTIPGDEIYYRLVDVGFRDSTRIQNTVEVELDSVLPLSLEELVITFLPAAPSGGTSRVFGYGIKKERLQHYLKLMNSAGIEPYVVDWEAVSLYAYSEKIVPDDGIVLLVNLEPDRAQLCYYSGSGLELTRGVKVSGIEILNEIRKGLEIVKQLSGKDLTRIYISAGSRSDEVVAKFRELFEVSCEVLNPVRFFPELEQVTVSRDYSLVLPFAALLRSISKRSTTGNFRRGEFAYRKSLTEIRSSLLIAGVVTGMLIVLTIGDIIYKYIDRKKVYNQIQSEITKVCSEVIKGYAPDIDCAKEMRKIFSRNNALMYSGTRVIDMLRELSIRISREITVDIQEITEEGEKVRIKGKAPTLDMVDRIKTELSKSTYFANVEVVDSKQDIDGKSFNFILSLILKESSQ